MSEAAVHPSIPHVHAGGKFSGILSAKVAGIPVKWVALVGAVGALAYAVKAKRADSQAAPAGAATDATATASGDATPYDSTTFEAKPPQEVVSSSGSAVAQSSVSADTNDDWQRRAIDWLIAPPQSVPFQDASTAIQKFLNGDSLSSAEGAIRDKALGQFGQPPQLPTVGAVAAPDLAPKRQGNPPTHHTVKGSHDNDAAKLANLYYGADSVEYQRTIGASNPTLGYTEWPVGTVVVIPVFHTPKYYKATAAVNTEWQIAAKNGTSAAHIEGLNPTLKFPVHIGVRVRVA